MIDQSHAGHVVIRRMERKDVSVVYAIDVLSFSLPWTERSYIYDLEQNPAARLWVAESIGEDGFSNVVGMLVLWIIVDEAHIGTLAVHPSSRRLGIGKKLMITAIAEVKESGVLFVLLEVRRSNTSAQSLYSALGFKVVGVRRHYYKDNNEDALLMTLEDL